MGVASPAVFSAMFMLFVPFTTKLRALPVMIVSVFVKLRIVSAIMAPVVIEPLWPGMRVRPFPDVIGPGAQPIL
jgi:hypothetical protein